MAQSDAWAWWELAASEVLDQYIVPDIGNIV